MIRKQVLYLRQDIKTSSLPRQQIKDTRFTAVLATTLRLIAVRSVLVCTTLRLLHTGTAGLPFHVNHFFERGLGGISPLMPIADTGDTTLQYPKFG
jgi:hypothetical protein